MDLQGGPILVFGATGRQGGAVARQLLQHGFAVRAVTRDPAKPDARRLHDLGAEVVHGDLDNLQSIEKVMGGMRGVFSVQNFWETGAEREIEQGKAVAEVAHAMNLDFMVYSSVGGAERGTGIPHFDSKFVIEGRISELGLKATVLRPVWFMENLLTMRDQINGGKFSMPLPAETPLQMIAVDDIGYFAAQAFLHPDEHAGKALELAGDELTMPQVARLLSQRLGRTVEYVPVPVAQVREKDPEAAIMFEWFDQQGYQADIEHLRVIHPQLLRFEQWLNLVDAPLAEVSVV